MNFEPISQETKLVFDIPYAPGYAADLAFLAPVRLIIRYMQRPTAPIPNMILVFLDGEELAPEERPAWVREIVDAHKPTTWTGA